MSTTSRVHLGGLLLAGLVQPLGPVTAQCTEDWLAPPVFEAGGAFGRGLDLQGDLLVVGADGVGTPGGGEGVLYVFREVGAEWALEVNIQGGLNNNGFGEPAVVDGELFLYGWDLGNELHVTAYWDEDGGAGDWIWLFGDSFPGGGHGLAMDIHEGLFAYGNASDVVKSIRWDGQSLSSHSFAQSPRPPAEQGDFGAAVGITRPGQTELLIVGEPESTSDPTAPGAVHVFREGSGWVFRQTLAPADVSIGDGFGRALSVDRETLVVTAPFQVGPRGEVGALYVYSMDTVLLEWVLVQKLVVDEEDAFLGFPVVDVDGDDLVASASALGELVAYYHFRRNASGLFALEDVIAPAGLTDQDGFGLGLALDDGRVAAGAPRLDAGPLEDVGGVVIHEFPPGCLAVTGVVPDAGLFHQQTSAVIGGLGFEPAPTAVSFGGAPATSVTWLSETTLLADAPPGVQGQVVDVTVTQGSEGDTLAGGFTYVGTEIQVLHPAAGNVTGGQSIVVTVSFPTTLADSSASVNGAPAAVVGQLSADTFELVTPGEVAVPGGPVDVVFTNANGVGVAVAGFTYTPALSVSVTGQTGTGGTLDLWWIDDPASTPGQLVWLWIDDPSVPDLPTTLPAFGGTLQSQPLVMVLSAFPVGFTPVALPFSPVPASLGGVPLSAQGVVTGEGGAKGSFTNVAGFQILP